VSKATIFVILILQVSF